MPLDAAIPPNVVGLYGVICPGRYWHVSYLPIEYETMAQFALTQLHGPVDEIIQIASQMLVDSVKMTRRPEFQELPDRHLEKQVVIRNDLAAGSVIAFLTNHRFFLVIYDNDITHVEPILATSVEAAYAVLMRRTDVRAMPKNKS